MLYWRAAMLSLGVATLLFPSPTEVRYQGIITEETGFHFFVEPSQAGFGAGFVVGFGG